MILTLQQEAAVEQLRSNNFNGIIWWAMGQGKSRIALRAAELSACKRVVIVCPKKAIPSWEQEINDTIFILPYQIISADSIYKLNLSEKEMAETGLIVDELYYFSSGDSKRSKYLRYNSAKFMFVIGLSGTIMPTQDNLTVWWQVRNLNLHVRGNVALDTSQFISKYKTVVVSPYSKGGFGGKQFVNKVGSLDKIKKNLGNYINIFFPKDGQLPIKESIVKVPLTQEQRKLIKSIREDFALSIGGEEKDLKYSIEVFHAVNKIVNGWYGENEQVKSNKIEEVLRLAEQFKSSKEQAIIWCAYRGDAIRLQKVLEGEGYSTQFFWGGEEFNSSLFEKQRTDFVIATVQSGASVNYFKHIKYAIYYSLPQSLTHFEQSKARTNRRGSNHGGAYYYYLIAQSPSFDWQVFNLLKQNRDVENQFIYQEIQKFFQER